MNPDIQLENFITELRKLRRTYPTLRIPLLIQAAMDNKKNRGNVNLDDMSDKESVSALREYNQKIKENRVRKPKQRVIPDDN